MRPGAPRRRQRREPLPAPPASRGRRRTSGTPATSGPAAGCGAARRGSIARRAVRRAGAPGRGARPAGRAARPAVAGRLLRPGQPLDGVRAARRTRRRPRQQRGQLAGDLPRRPGGVQAHSRRPARVAVSSSHSAPAVPSAIRRRRCSTADPRRRAQDDGDQQRHPGAGQQRRSTSAACWPAARPGRPRRPRSVRGCRGAWSAPWARAPQALVRAVLGARARRPGQVDRAVARRSASGRTAPSRGPRSRPPPRRARRRW